MSKTRSDFCTQSTLNLIRSKQERSELQVILRNAQNQLNQTVIKSHRPSFLPLQDEQPIDISQNIFKAYTSKHGFTNWDQQVDNILQEEKFLKDYGPSCVETAVKNNQEMLDMKNRFLKMQKEKQEQIAARKHFLLNPPVVKIVEEEVKKDPIRKVSKKRVIRRQSTKAAIPRVSSKKLIQIKPQEKEVKPLFTEEEIKMRELSKKLALSPKIRKKLQQLTDQKDFLVDFGRVDGGQDLINFNRTRYREFKYKGFDKSSKTQGLTCMRLNKAKEYEPQPNRPSLDPSQTTSRFLQKMEIFQTNKSIADSPSKLKHEPIVPLAQSKISNSTLRLINYPHDLKSVLKTEISQLHVEKCNVKNLSQSINRPFKSLIIRHEEVNLTQLHLFKENIPMELAVLKIEFCKVEGLQQFLETLQ